MRLDDLGERFLAVDEGEAFRWIVRIQKQVDAI